MREKIYGEDYKKRQQQDDVVNVVLRTVEQKEDGNRYTPVQFLRMDQDEMMRLGMGHFGVTHRVRFYDRITGEEKWFVMKNFRSMHMKNSDHVFSPRIHMHHMMERWNMLRDAGFPVVDHMFIGRNQSNKNDALFMTDLTDGGKYSILSNNQSYREKNFGRFRTGNVYEIRNFSQLCTDVVNVARNAARHGIYTPWDSIFIVMDDNDVMAPRYERIVLGDLDAYALSKDLVRAIYRRKTAKNICSSGKTMKDLLFQKNIRDMYVSIHTALVNEDTLIERAFLRYSALLRRARYKAGYRRMRARMRLAGRFLRHNI